jgi:hypothetical protein
MGRKSFKAYKLAAVAKDLRQDYTQQRFQRRENLSSKLANTTYYQLPRHNHLLKRRAFCMLCRIQKNSPQFDPDDVIDLIGEDFDVDDAEDEEDELDEIDVPYVKARLRRICVFSIHALRESLPIELDTIPVAFFRRVARHCLRFMTLGLKPAILWEIIAFLSFAA